MYPRIVNFKVGKGHLQVKLVYEKTVGPQGSDRFFCYGTPKALIMGTGTLFATNAILY